jgi:hypothetical protein
VTRPHLLPAVLLALALAVTGCGASEKKSPAPKAEPTPELPTGNVKVPAGITLTKAGTVLKFTEPALVAYQPNTQRSSVLRLSVDSVQTGRISDFAGYQLDAQTKRSRPYYVRVSVKNVGTGDLSRSAIPLLAVDNRNALIQPSSFNNTFTRCPSRPLPSPFTAGKQLTACLVYIIPSGGTLDSMSYRPLQAFEPITWKGTVLPVPSPKKAGAKKPSPKKTPPRDQKKKG